MKLALVPLTGLLLGWPAEPSEKGAASLTERTLRTQSFTGRIFITENVLVKSAAPTNLTVTPESAGKQVSAAWGASLSIGAHARWGGGGGGGGAAECGPPFLLGRQGLLCKQQEGPPEHDPQKPPQSEGHLGPTLSPLASLVHPLTLTGSGDHVSRLLLATQRQSSLKR